MGERMEIKIIEVLNIDRLAEKISENEIQDKSALYYFIAGNIFFIYFAFVTSYVFGYGYLEYETALAEALVNSIITIFGIFACYKAYQGGSNFIQAFIVLSVPALIYSTFLFWTLNWGFLYTVKKFSKTRSFQTSAEADTFITLVSRIIEIGTMATYVITALCFFYFVRRGLTIASAKNNDKAPCF